MCPDFPQDDDNKRSQSWTSLRAMHKRSSSVILRYMKDCAKQSENKIVKVIDGNKNINMEYELLENSRATKTCSMELFNN